MASTTSRGNYYKRKTKDYYEKLGYVVQLTEFMCASVFKGKCFYRKIDIFGSDGIAMNGEEIIFWNSKHSTTTKESMDRIINYGKADFEKYPFPDYVKKQIVMWQPRKKPEIIEC